MSTLYLTTRDINSTIFLSKNILRFFCVRKAACIKTELAYDRQSNVQQSIALGPKYTGIPGINARGALNQAAWSLQWAIHGEAAPWNRALQTRVPPWIQSLMRHDLPTLLWHVGQRTCIVWSMYRVEHSCWPSICHCSPPSLDPVCSTLCSNFHNFLLARHVILHDFLWHVQFMVHGSWSLGWFNPLFFEPVGTSPHPPPPFDWGKLVYSVANQKPGLMRRALSK